MSKEHLTLFARLKQAAKTDAEWKEIDPVLELGEEVYVIVHDNPMILSYKIGDGQSKYSELDFSLTQGEGIISYAPSSVNIGYHTQVGTLGYRITDFHCNKEGVTSTDLNPVLIEEGGTYTIELAEGEFLPAELVGKTYSIHLRAAQELAGTITAVNDNVITVKPFYYPSKWDHKDIVSQRDYYFQESYIFCNELPNVGNIRIGSGATVMGYESTAVQFASNAEGYRTMAAGKYGHTEGKETFAGYAAHAQNISTKASGYHSHAQNYYTQAIGWNSSSSGSETQAIGKNSDAGGEKTIAKGQSSFARGYQTEAQHNNSVALNRRTITGRDHQTVVGQFNKVDNNAMFVVGGGSTSASGDVRRNAMAVYPDGRTQIGDAVNDNEAITKKQLNNITKKIVISTNNLNNTWLHKEGWYQIATTQKGINVCSGIFKIKARTSKKGNWSVAIVCADLSFSQHKALPSITVLSSNYHNTRVIDAIRLVWSDVIDSKQANYYNNCIGSLQVHCTKEAVNEVEGSHTELFIELLDNLNNTNNTDWYAKTWQLADYSKEYNRLPASADAPLPNSAVAKGPRVLEKNLDAWALSNLDVPKVARNEYWDDRISDTYPDSIEDGRARITFTNIASAILHVLICIEFNGHISTGGAYISGSNSNMWNEAHWYCEDAWGLMSDSYVEADYDNHLLTIALPYSTDGVRVLNVYVKSLDGYSVKPYDDIQISYNEGE